MSLEQHLTAAACFAVLLLPAAAGATRRATCFILTTMAENPK